MAIVRKPGGTIRWVLKEDQKKDPTEQAVLNLKVLDFDEWRKLLACMEQVTSADQVIEGLRKILGIALVDVQNLKVMGDDGKLEDFVLKRVGYEITKESMSCLMPFRDEILEAIKKTSQFGVDDAKN